MRAVALLLLGIAVGLHWVAAVVAAAVCLDFEVGKVAFNNVLRENITKDLQALYIRPYLNFFSNDNLTIYDLKDLRN